MWFLEIINKIVYKIQYILYISGINIKKDLIVN